MKNGTYNEAVFLPEQVSDLVPRGEFELQYTFHAVNAAKSDRYGNLNLPKTLNLSEVMLAEVTVEDKTMTKVVVRHPYTETLDLVFVLIPHNNRMMKVKTVWGNKANDNHKTLKAHHFIKG